MVIPLDARVLGEWMELDEFYELKFEAELLSAFLLCDRDAKKKLSDFIRRTVQIDSVHTAEPQLERPVKG